MSIFSRAALVGMACAGFSPSLGAEQTGEIRGFVVNVLATHLAPYDFRISANFEWLSGYHWEKKGWSTAYGGYLTLPEDRGGRTTPAHAYLDLGVNVHNVFNSQRPVSYVKQDTELFGQVWGRQLPRWAQIRLGLRF